MTKSNSFKVILSLIVILFIAINIVNKLSTAIPIVIDAIVIVIRSNGIFKRPIVPKIVKHAIILGIIVTKAI